MTEKFSKVGTLIFVVGPSGSGKDTLINGAKDLVRKEKFTFITREITRSADAGGEDHIEITKRDFDKKVKASGDVVKKFESTTSDLSRILFLFF